MMRVRPQPQRQQGRRRGPVQEPTHQQLHPTQSGVLTVAALQRPCGDEDRTDRIRFVMPAELNGGAEGLSLKLDNHPHPHPHAHQAQHHLHQTHVKSNLQQDPKWTLNLVHISKERDLERWLATNGHLLALSGKMHQHQVMAQFLVQYKDKRLQGKSEAQIEVSPRVTTCYHRQKPDSRNCH